MHVLVLGSGLIGTTSAWYLARAGHEVTVLDRQPASGLETSFANGGQISVSHAEPWANPHAPGQILRWLGRRDAPLLFRMRVDPALWSWGLRFLLECRSSRTRDNIRQLVNLGLYSRAALGELRQAADISYDHLERGILHFYTRDQDLAAGVRAAREMRAYGCDSEPVSAEECFRIEPSLRRSTVPVLGGTFTPSDESGDAHAFTRTLAKRCAERGVTFRYEHCIDGILQADGMVSAVRARDAQGAEHLFRADAYVVALGSYSPLLLRPLGIRLPVYPAKGYSLTLAVTEGDSAPVVSLTDDEQKLVFSRLGNRLRVAGTAEFNGYDTSLDTERCAAIRTRVEALFPDAGDFATATYWAGLRPATPGNVPFIGRSALPNLYLNTGHGTLGWTHSCGSGMAIAEILSGRVPDVDFRFTGLDQLRHAPRGSRSALRGSATGP